MHDTPSILPQQNIRRPSIRRSAALKSSSLGHMPWWERLETWWALPWWISISLDLSICMWAWLLLFSKRNSASDFTLTINKLFEHQNIVDILRPPTADSSGVVLVFVRSDDNKLWLWPLTHLLSSQFFHFPLEFSLRIQSFHFHRLTFSYGKVCGCSVVLILHYIYSWSKAFQTIQAITHNTTPNVMANWCWLALILMAWGLWCSHMWPREKQDSSVNKLRETKSGCTTRLCKDRFVSEFMVCSF